jgi:hypothetical protein
MGEGAGDEGDAAMSDSDTITSDLPLKGFSPLHVPLANGQDMHAGACVFCRAQAMLTAGDTCSGVWGCAPTGNMR